MGSWIISVVILTIAALTGKSIGHNYGDGFLNHSRCLYTYLDGGELELHTADGDVVLEDLDTKLLIYDSARTKCVNAGDPGKVVFHFKTDEKSKIKLITVGMRIVPSLSEGIWEISQANLTIVSAETERKRTFPLRIWDMYASLSHSYSCNELNLQTLPKKRPSNESGFGEPRAFLTLRRFQLQPFAELENYIFAPSFDCSTWFSIPGIMGFALILFMITVTIIGTILLQNINTNDFKYNKEGIQFTQSQMESNKQR